MGVWNHSTIQMHPSTCGPATLRLEVTKGLFAYRIAGVPSRQLKESEVRFCSAVRHAGFPSPKTQLHKISVALDGHKDEKFNLSLYETAILVGYAGLSGHIPLIDRRVCILGSIDLGGEAAHSYTLYAALRTALAQDFHTIYIPESAAMHASTFLSDEHFSREDQRIYSYKNISDLIRSLGGTRNKDYEVRPAMHKHFDAVMSTYLEQSISHTLADNPLDAASKRALLISCIGHHPLALWGPPGQGKTAAFQCLETCLPPQEPALRAKREHIASIWGIRHEKYLQAPITTHHSLTLADFFSTKKYSIAEQAQGHALVMDEFIDFKNDVILSVRELFDAPLKGGHATLIIAGFNPCPCGKYGTDVTCTCRPAARQRYAHKIPDSVWDRFHIYSKTQLEKDMRNGTPQKIKPLREIYSCAQERRRQLSLSSWQNGRLNGPEISMLSTSFETRALDLLRHRTESFLSARKRLHAIIVSRTIADLDASDSVRSEHALEALSLIAALPFGPHATRHT